MRTISTLLAAISLTTFGIGPALSACPETTGSISGEQHQGISKDGTHAPLEGQSNNTASAPVEPDNAAKDGATMPLANKEGGGNKDLATSGQDVQAQQKGQKTAMAEATDCKE